MIGHCIECGKAYKYWGWIYKHFQKEHPESLKPNPITGMPQIFLIKEVMDAHNKEAEWFLNMPKSEWRNNGT